MATYAETKPNWLVTPDKIAAVVERLVEQVHPSRIYIFGSAARGEIHRHSDLDLLVIMPHDIPKGQDEAMRMRAIVRDIPVAKDILVISEAEAEAAKDNRYGIIGPTLRTGKLAYQAPK